MTRSAIRTHVRAIDGCSQHGGRVLSLDADPT
jgi:hypothetical protein